MNIEELRDFSLSLPGATEDIKWGADLCFLVGDKMFCVTSLDPPHQVSFKVKEDDFDTLTALPEFVPAPYLARYKWVKVEKWNSLTDQEWEDRILNSYMLVKAKLPKAKLKTL